MVFLTRCEMVNHSMSFNSLPALDILLSVGHGVQEVDVLFFFHKKAAFWAVSHVCKNVLTALG